MKWWEGEGEGTWGSIRIAGSLHSLLSMVVLGVFVLIFFLDFSRKILLVGFFWGSVFSLTFSGICVFCFFPRLIVIAFFSFVFTIFLLILLLLLHIVFPFLSYTYCFLLRFLFFPPSFPLRLLAINHFSPQI